MRVVERVKDTCTCARAIKKRQDATYTYAMASFHGPQMALKLPPNSSTMSETVVQASLKLTPTPWITMFGRLRQYQEVHGHCCVSAGHDAELQDWTLLQITHYKSGTLSDYHKKMLDTIGFKFPKKFLVMDPDEHDDASECSADKVFDAPSTEPVKKKPPTKVPLEANMKFVNCNAQAVQPLKIPLTPPEKKQTAASSDAPPVPCDAKPKVVPAPIPKDPTISENPPVKKQAPPKITLLSSVAKVRPGPAKEVWSGVPDDDLEGGWPAGWIKKTFQRASGASVGSFDSYWYPPGGGKKLRSMVEVRRFLGLPPRPTKKKSRIKRPAAVVSSQQTTSAGGITTGNTAIVTNGHVKKRAKKTKHVVVKPERPQFTEEEIMLVRSFVPK